MRGVLFCCLLFALFAGCRKQGGSRVDIYLLKSHTTSIDQSVIPVITVISNAVLADEPLVADEDISYYRQSTHTFWLKKDIQAVIQPYGPDKAFAVTVDGQPVYYGRFHPLYLSSITLGIATIAPGISAKNELAIEFVRLQGNPAFESLDKRNDPRIIAALKASGKLR